MCAYHHNYKYLYLGGSTSSQALLSEDCSSAAPCCLGFRRWQVSYHFQHNFQKLPNCSHHLWLEGCRSDQVTTHRPFVNPENIENPSDIYFEISVLDIMKYLVLKLVLLSIKNSQELKSLEGRLYI